MEICCFPEQHKEEKILMVIRKHFMAYVKVIALFLLIFVLPVALTVFLVWSYGQEMLSRQTLLIGGVFACLYLLYGMGILVALWINEAFDIFILTNERLVDITQVNFFGRTLTATPLNQIQDTTSTVDGFLKTILNYGNVAVKTASGNASLFYIDSVPRPDQVAQRILSEARKWAS